MQIPRGSTAPVRPHAVTIGTTVVLDLLTGMVAVYDQGRFDHQPFNWMGQQVFPVLAGDGNGWGFWFLGQWIPL